MRISDWSSDVCSSDLAQAQRAVRRPAAARGDRPRDRVRSDAADLRRAHRRPRPPVGRGNPGPAAGAQPRARQDIVMVTHDPKAAEYASHTLHLDKGTLVEQATQE